MKRIALSFSFATISIILLLSDALAAFPVDHYPAGNHPRLWITAERLAAFQLASQTNTPRWQEFKQTCDNLIDDDPNNDIWNLDRSPQVATAPLALMYRLTGDGRYADRAMELMDATQENIDGYSNPDHASFHYLGLAYDWLYDYPGMTEPKKQAYEEKIVSISDSFWVDSNGEGTHTANGDTDANIESGMIHLTMGAAVYGETDRAVDLLDRGWLGWDVGYGGFGDPPKNSNSDFVRKSLGGVYPTGYSYFSGSDSVGISGYWMTFSTACNYDVIAEHPELAPFWANTIRSMIHLTEPSQQKIFHTGDWQDPNILSAQAWLYQVIAFATFFADEEGYSDIAARGRGYAAALDLGYHIGWFTEFFFSTPGRPVTIPYQEGLPLVRFADEPDFLLFRDNWSSEASWGMFVGDGSIPADHQPPDHGNFVLWRGNDYLTRGVRHYGALGHGDFFNTLSIENGCTVNGSDCSGTAIRSAQAPASLARHRVQQSDSLFGYAMLQGDGQWNDDPERWHPVLRVETYRRHFFWSGDYVIVFDRLRTTDEGWSKYRLRALTEPSINGAVITQYSENGQHKLLHRTLEPAGAEPVIVDESSAWSNLQDWNVNLSERRWQSVIDLPVSDHVNVLNVMQMGPASMVDFDTLEHIQTDDRSGVRIGDWVVLFTAEEQLAASASYTVNNAPAGLHHLVADLVPGKYQVKVNGSEIQSLEVLADDNTAYFVTDIASPALTIEITGNESKKGAMIPVLFFLLPGSTTAE